MANQSTASDHYTLTVTAIHEERPDFKTFILKPDKPIDYKAGQYLTLVHTEKNQDIRRSYSITSSPALQEPLSIGVKRIENGFFSRRLVDDVQVGDKVYAAGAAGLFILPENMHDYRQVFLLAAGSGITPELSLLKTILYTYPDVAVMLIYSNSKPAKAIYKKELEQLAHTFPKRFRLQFLFSNSPNLAQARLYKDLLQQFVRQFAEAPLQQVLFYICGPHSYMRMCYWALRQIDAPNENIRRENFNTTKVSVKQMPPDTEPHEVILRYKDREYKLTMEYPDTILRAARKAGLNLPYSCEAGKCGNCTARCTKGKVWMSYNEVLTERDLQQGLTLTCVGYPVGGPAVLEL
ncbi:iron-sulfur cluster-binding domain-containing protein [Pontibacter anaerobius]|uniref:Iron-sulfur cluster-binding domain-containing protein n=1 Tax=Pontibacter anaerobius TaxID=2993940 RepID=A0ABT3RIM5_9BACT|nr:iron-sulfur cluster-binding domain-containing protein [Pontibacter anaerobius]MCX2741202.1 iron-sulfur cluster-binding domain-containing protein [Pontibacter anaerobius]